MNKIRVLVANAPEEIGGVTCWRMFWPLSLIEHTDGSTFEIRYSRGVIYPFEFYQTDILICYRPSKPEHLQIMAEAKRIGVKIVVDFDDDHVNMAIGHPGFKQLGMSSQIGLNAVEICDALWLSSRHLTAVYKHKNTYILPNGVLPEIVAVQPQDYEHKTGVWAGSDAHREDADAFASQYKSMLRQLKSFVWINFMPTWATKVAVEGCSINYHPWIHTEEYFDTLRKLHTTVIWKPLVANKFNLAKTNISWITATVVGGVCVSNFAPSKGQKEEGREAWQFATREAPASRKEFVEIWERSADQVRKQYNILQINQDRITSLLKLVNG